MTNADSFNHLPKWLKYCEDAKGDRESLIGVLLGNKMDNQDFIKVNTSLGEVFAKKNQLEFVQLSTVSGRYFVYSL